MKITSRCTHGAAALVRLVAEAAPLPAFEEGRATGGRWLALAESAVVLVHEETVLAVKVALEFGADALASITVSVQVGVVARRITRRCLARAHRAAVLVLQQVTVQPTVRQFRANFVIFRQHIRHGVDLLEETGGASLAREIETAKEISESLLSGKKEEEREREREFTTHARAIVARRNLLQLRGGFGDKGNRGVPPVLRACITRYDAADGCSGCIQHFASERAGDGSGQITAHCHIANNGRGQHSFIASRSKSISSP